MDDIAEFLTARYAEEAKRWQIIWRFKAGDKRIDGWWDLGGTLGHAVNAIIDPTFGGRDLAAKRAILAEVMSWPHTYFEGDTWFSCAQAVSTFDEDGTPGSGCADDNRAGGPCDCGLDRRRAAILHPLAKPYTEHSDYNPAWSLT